MLAKIGSENGKYMVEFQADARVGFGKCIHFRGRSIGLDNYKGKESLSRVVVTQKSDDR